MANVIEFCFDPVEHQIRFSKDNNNKNEPVCGLRVAIVGTLGTISSRTKMSGKPYFIYYLVCIDMHRKIVCGVASGDQLLKTHALVWIKNLNHIDKF
jgi:hypothetical protein